MPDLLAGPWTTFPISELQSHSAGVPQSLGKSASEVNILDEAERPLGRSA